MSVPNLESLLKEVLTYKYETQNVEIKAAKKGCPRKLYNTLSSFSNQNEGGKILFGINEKEDFKVCGVYDVHDLQKKVTEIGRQMFPVVEPKYSVLIIENKPILIAEISPIPYEKRPCFYLPRGKYEGSYKRIGESDQKMSRSDVYNYENFRDRIHSDRELIIDDRECLDTELIKRFLTEVKKGKPNLTNNLSEEEILRFMNIKQDNFLTKAGALIFSIEPQIYFPQLSVHALAHHGTEYGQVGDFGERFLDNKNISGPITVMVEESVRFVEKNTCLKTIIDHNGRRADRYDYPIEAVREAILNALIHRDYSYLNERKPTRLDIFKDRIEISSPGGLFGDFTVDQLGNIPCYTRNETIVRILEILGVTENRFTGIPTIRKLMEKYELDPPIFIDRNNEFKVIFYKHRSKEKKVMDDISNSKQRETTNIPGDPKKNIYTREYVKDCFGNIYKL